MEEEIILKPKPNRKTDLLGDAPSDSKDILILENHIQRTAIVKGNGCVGWMIAWAIVILFYTIFADVFPVLRTILLIILALLIFYYLMARVYGFLREITHFILDKRFFSPFHTLILKHRYHVITHKTLRQKTLALYNQANQPFFTLLIKFLAYNQDYLQQVGPVAQNLIQQCKDTHFDIKAVNDVYDYYYCPTTELITQYMQSPPISPELRERIVFEADMTDRRLLERELPPQDPLLIELADHDHIGLPDGFKILI